MYAIVYKADGYPICRQVPGVSPDPVVTWNTEDSARAFITSKGGDADFQPLRLTDDAMEKMMASFPIGRLIGFPGIDVTYEQVEQLLAAANAGVVPQA